MADNDLGARLADPAARAEFQRNIESKLSGKKEKELLDLSLAAENKIRGLSEDAPINEETMQAAVKRRGVSQAQDAAERLTQLAMMNKQVFETLASGYNISVSTEPAARKTKTERYNELRAEYVKQSEQGNWRAAADDLLALNAMLRARMDQMRIDFIKANPKIGILAADEQVYAYGKTHPADRQGETRNFNHYAIEGEHGVFGKSLARGEGGRELGNVIDSIAYNSGKLGLNDEQLAEFRKESQKMWKDRIARREEEIKQAIGAISPEKAVALRAAMDAQMTVHNDPEENKKWGIPSNSAFVRSEMDKALHNVAGVTDDKVALKEAAAIAARLSDREVREALDVVKGVLKGKRDVVHQPASAQPDQEKKSENFITKAMGKLMVLFKTGIAALSRESHGEAAAKKAQSDLTAKADDSKHTHRAAPQEELCTFKPNLPQALSGNKSMTV